MITKKEAKRKIIPGWNIKCNLCGDYGANWITRTPSAKPRFGCLALCHKHEKEYLDEEDRHRKEIARLSVINFEQDIE
ncbi:MAG: hypothetical protein V1701_02705 [Planctomycetota bacterium]